MNKQTLIASSVRVVCAGGVVIGIGAMSGAAAQESAEPM